MPKNEFTPRDELICGKLDALHGAIVSGELLTALDLLEAVRHDAERMEAKLAWYKHASRGMAISAAKLRKRKGRG